MIDRRDRDWSLWLIGWVCLFALSFALDGVIGSGLSAFRRGDVERELAALGQWGQLSSLVIVSVILICVHSTRWRRLLDLWLAAGLTSVVSLLLKIGFGRMRPRMESPYGFDGLLVHSGENDSGGQLVELSHYALSSFPSSHTSAAMVLSLFVALVWPRLWGFGLAMIVVVGLSRYAFAAHWASDVLGGATIGLLVGYPVVRGLWGVRLCDWLWKCLVDRGATPALPEVVSGEIEVLDRTR